MCGRFALFHSPEAIAAAFELNNVPELNARYNIAPTQPIATVLHTSKRSQQQLKFLRWGLIPKWAKDREIGSRLINARAETLTEKPSFRDAFQKRRCLIIASGFYEWQTLKGKKQPFYIHLKNNEPFAFAGLWEHWQDPQAEIIESCTILTTEANELVQPIHNRMPVILRPEDYSTWLNPDLNEPAQLQPLLQAYRPQMMTAYPVNTIVNKPTNDSSECIDPVSAA